MVDTSERYNILHSVGVIVVHSIRQMTFARTSSPFNIHESISISNFTMDIVVFEKRGKKTAIECKIWRGLAYQDDAREQLVDYLVHENLSSGYLVFFNHRENAS